MIFLGHHSLRNFATIWLASLCLIVANASVAQEIQGQLPEPNTQRAAPEDLPTSTIPSEEDYVASPVLTVDQERLFTESAWGKRVARELEEKGQQIISDNKRIEKQMSDEEAELTALRDTLNPAEFRKQAEAFDTRAMEVRRERAAIVQELNDTPQEERVAFFKAAMPIMGEVMQRRKAAVVLDRRTVLVLLEAIDITNELIEEIDARIGEGPEPKEAPKEDNAGNAP